MRLKKKKKIPINFLLPLQRCSLFFNYQLIPAGEEEEDFTGFYDYLFENDTPSITTTLHVASCLRELPKNWALRRTSSLPCRGSLSGKWSGNRSAGGDLVPGLC